MIANTQRMIEVPRGGEVAGSGALLMKQKQLLVKSKESQELLTKNARFEQIWKSRKGKEDAAASHNALREMCHFYDVVHVDAGETSGVHKQDDDEDERLMHSYTEGPKT